MILIRTTIAETRPLDVSRDAWRQISRDAHADQGAYWHEHFLPDHFTERAKFRYHHQARTTRYKRDKRRAAARGGDRRGPVLMGGVVDNVRTGLLMRTMLSAATIRAFPSRVTIVMAGPRYISMKPNTYSGSNQPNKAKEITTVTRAQRQKLGRVLGDSIASRLNAYRALRTTTIGA